MSLLYYYGELVLIKTLTREYIALYARLLKIGVTLFPVLRLVR